MKIVLVHPAIPQNTGSIGRLCAATQTPLVLVEPLGFSLDSRYLKRAGLDYWPWIDLQVVADWREALDGPGRSWLFTKRARRPYVHVDYGPDDKIVFGNENHGLPAELYEAYPGQSVLIPFENPGVRSLNLAQCAAVGLFEARRQLGIGL